MKKFSLLLLILGFYLLGHSQTTADTITWIKLDTCRTKVIVVDSYNIEVVPEMNDKFSELWDLLLKDKTFQTVEEVRAYLEPYDFRSVSVEIVEDNLIFYFEKIVKETYTFITNKL